MRSAGSRRCWLFTREERDRDREIGWKKWRSIKELEHKAIEQDVTTAEVVKHMR